MSALVRICSRCHARVTLDTAESFCPACGGTLMLDPAGERTVQAGQVDHRGIVLPPRHAVGGVITPR